MAGRIIIAARESRWRNALEGALRSEKIEVEVTDARQRLGDLLWRGDAEGSVVAVVIGRHVSARGIRKAIKMGKKSDEEASNKRGKPPVVVVSSAVARRDKELLTWLDEHGVEVAVPPSGSITNTVDLLRSIVFATQRRFPRIPLLTTVALESDQGQYRGRTLDVSEGGLGLLIAGRLSGSSFSMGDHVVAQFVLLGESIKVRARVRYVGERRVLCVRRLALGLSFIDLDSDSTELIRGYSEVQGALAVRSAMTLVRRQSLQPA